MNRWRRVPFDTEEPTAGALIKIFRRGGRTVATVTEHRWYEPDGHKHTGYVDIATTEPAPAVEVLSEYKKALATVALETGDLWDDAWGRLI